MRTLGLLLLILGLGWIVWDRAAGFPPPRRLDLVTNVVGFEGSAKLPADQIEASLNEAKAKVDSKVACSDWYASYARGADWAAFLLTATITLIGGFLGMGPGQAGGSPPMEEVARRSAWLGRVVAILAALAAVVTAGGAKLQTTSEALFKNAQDMRRTALAVQKDVNDAKTEGDARVVLARLEELRGGCSQR